MVRWPSGVTSTRQRPVGSPPLAAGGVEKVTPAVRMSWPKTSPNWSLDVLPMKPARPPNEAMPTMVLATEPPEISMAGPMSP